MTKRHFIRAAEMVKAIRDGHWTNKPPDWCFWCSYGVEDTDENMIRAVQTAEFCILLFKEENSRFDETRFLQACGLVAKPERKGKANADLSSVPGHNPRFDEPYADTPERTLIYYAQHGARRRYFLSLDDAKAYAERIFKRTGNIVGIQQTSRKRMAKAGAK